MLNEREIDRYSLALLRWAYGKTGDHDRAEELVQEIWLQIFAALRRDNAPIRDMERFLWKVAKYTWYRHLRQLSRHMACVPIDDETLPGDTDFAEELAENEEVRRQIAWLRRRISTLNRNQQDILLMFYLEHLPVREIARRLSLSESTVKWHLHDTRKKLKEAYETMEQTNYLYHPRKLRVGLNGYIASVLAADTQFINNSPVKQNLCLACYYTPRTLPQLSDYLGIPAGYLESELKWLVEKEFMTETKQGYVTTFFIITNKQEQECFAVHKQYRAQVIDIAIEGLLAAEKEIRAIGFHGSDLPMNKLMWLLIYRLYNHLSLPVQPIPAPYRPDGGRYWPRGFDRTEQVENPAVDHRGWAFNGSMSNHNFHWFGLYNFGDAEVEDLIDGYTAEWQQLLATLTAVLQSQFDVTGFNEQQRLDLAKLAQKGFVTVKRNRAVPNFCVFTKAQEEQLVERVFRPILDRMQPGVQALTEALRSLCFTQLPRQLQSLADQSVHHAMYDVSWLTYIFAFQDGRLYVPKDKQDGMFLTLMFRPD